MWGSVKSFPACIVVYKTQRPAFVFNWREHTTITVILKIIFFPSLYKIVAIPYHANVHINTKLLCIVCLNPDPNKGPILLLIRFQMHVLVLVMKLVVLPKY